MSEPSEEELWDRTMKRMKLIITKRMKEYDNGNPRSMCKFLCSTWVKPYGTISWRGGWLVMTTGGWSENEIIIDILQKTAFWERYWFRSEVGGAYWFRIA